MVRARSNGPRRGYRDPAWKYCHSLREGDATTIVCNYCNKIITAGITRAKEHLMGKKGNVSPCLSCPKDVKDELWRYFNSTNKLAKKLSDEELPPVEGSESKDDECENSNIATEQEKEAKDRVHQCIARFWYQAGLSFDLMKLKSFEEMVEAIGARGKHLDVSTYHDIIVPLIKEMEDNKEQRNEPIMCTREEMEKRKVPSSGGALTASQTSEKQAMNTSSASEQVEMLKFEDSNGEKCVKPLNESVGMEDQLTVVVPTKPTIRFVYSRRKKKGVNEIGQTLCELEREEEKL